MEYVMISGVIVMLTMVALVLIVMVARCCEKRKGDEETPLLVA